jgi:hypothetical protein
MNFSLKPSTIISHFLPGAFFLLAVAAMREISDSSSFTKLCAVSGPTVALLGGVGFPLALIVGLIFDALRNWLWERWRDHYDPMEWDVFARGEEKFRESLIESYYGYYVFDVNLLISIAFALVTSFILCIAGELQIKWTVIALAVALAIIIVLFFDAKDLRAEIAKLARAEMARLEAQNAEQTAT